jgi:DNA-binding winged helix-turn-helix (wHTH) protein
VNVRILADREPYASFSEQTLSRGDFVACGPPAVDAVAPDIVVIPASDFLSLMRQRNGSPGFLAYGPVALMGRAFENGCLDYLREPWSLPELDARLGRLENSVFRAGGGLFRLEGSKLASEGRSLELKAEELKLIRLLLRNAPFPVTRQAADAAMRFPSRAEAAALRRCVVSLRHSLERLSPGLGCRLKSVKGVGYRFDVDRCG